MPRSSPTAMNGRRTASTNVISPANAAATCPGNAPPAPVMLVASRHSAPAVANRIVQPIGTSATASSASAHPRARCESSGMPESAISGGPVTHSSASATVSSTWAANSPAAKTTPTITRNAPNTPPPPREQRAAEQHADDAPEPC